MGQRLLLLLLFSYLINGSFTGRSAKLRIHQNGINYVAGVAKEILEKELKAVQIPEQRFSEKGIHARFFNIALHSLGLPSTNFTFQDGGLVLTTSGGFVDGRFRFQASKRFIVKLTTSGNADIHLSNMISRMVLEWKQGTDKPQLRVAACEGRLDQFKITLHGNIIVGLVNMFIGKIGRSVRDAVSKKICPEVSKQVEERLNKILAELPSLFPVTKEGKRIFSIEYDDLATSVGPNFLDISTNAAFLFNGKKCIAVIQKTFPDGPATHMLSAWGSQGIPDCLLQAFHESNQLQYLITNKTEKIAPYLRTSCPFFHPLCIGSLFPKLATDYPNRSVDILIYSTAPPNVTINLQGIKIHGYSSVNIIIDKKTLACFQLNLTAIFVPKLKGSHFFGTILVKNAHMRLTASTIGQIDPKILELAGPAIAIGATYILYPIAEKGIVIPGFQGLKMADSSSISLLDGYLRSDVDVVRGPTDLDRNKILY